MYWPMRASIEGDRCAPVAVGEPSEASCTRSLAVGPRCCGASWLNRLEMAAALNFDFGAFSSPDLGLGAALSLAFWLRSFEMSSTLRRGFSFGFSGSAGVSALTV